MEWHPDTELAPHLRRVEITEKDPSRLQFMTDSQRDAFAAFQSNVEPKCRLHGSIVYGLATSKSDVDVCVPDIQTLGDFCFQPFEVKEDLLHLRIPRLLLCHENGTELDVVGMECYDETKDTVMTRLCSEPTFKNFFAHIRSWMKSYPGLVPAHGYPNTFNMLLLGVFFLQLVGILPSWSCLASSDPPLLSFPDCFVDKDAFPNFMEFLSKGAGCCKMDLSVGKWQEKRNRNTRTWHLLAPTHNRQLLSGFDLNQINQVIEVCVHPELSKGSYKAWLKYR